MKLFIVLLFCIATVGSSHRASWSVVDFGAVGDGKVDDTQAFLKAWTTMCESKLHKPMLIVPKGKTFLLKPLTFEGPCQSPNVRVSISGNIVAPSIPWGNDSRKWIVFSNVNGLVVNGHGQIDGQGAKWWEACPTVKENCQRPSALSFSKCQNFQLRGLTHINSQRNHLSISGCQNGSVSGIRMTAPEDSPNTDGINISSSTNVRITNSFIGTGDDCIAVNSETSHIYVTGVTCGPGHGISIGSLGMNGDTAAVEEVHVKDCTFTSTQNGVRIKTWVGGSGYAKKISFKNITLIGTYNPIIIDQHYCPHNACKMGVESAVQISDVTFNGFRGTTATETAIQLNCSEYKGCRNVILEHIDIKPVQSEPVSALCTNVSGRATDTKPEVDCIKNE